VNQHVAGKEVDFLFADHRLIVEADSWRYHKTRRSFESDRDRDVVTAQAGYRTVRFTDRRLANEPAAVARALRALFTAARQS
jgi:very-short-patch-repair endonuclease